MYQQEKKKNNFMIVNIALVISWIIIAIGIWYVFFSDRDATPTTVDNEVAQQEEGGELIKEPTYYIGEKILAEGSMSATDSYTMYTHNFTTNKGVTFGLKSRDIELYTYSGHVQLKGEINDFKKDLPIILVTEIIATDVEGNMKEEKVNGNPDYYLFKDEGLGFDLSISNGYTVEKQGDEILLIDLESENQAQTVLSISPFPCTPGHATKDCSVLKKRFTDIGSETFVSSQGITFYNLTETNTWVMFQDALNYGYYVTSLQDAGISRFAGFIGTFSESMLEKTIEQELSTICKNINYTLSTPDKITYTYQDHGLVHATILGTAEDSINLTCKVGLRLGETIQVRRMHFSDDAIKEQIDNIQDDVPSEAQKDDDKEIPTLEKTDIDGDSDDTEPVGIVQPDTETQVPANWSGSGWFKYTSVRGYDVYFSNKSVSYAGNILESRTDLGIEGLSCPYKVQVIQRKHADQVTVSPDIEIYECSGTIDTSTLTANNLKQVGNVDGTLFITKRYSNNLGDMTILVE